MTFYKLITRPFLFLLSPEASHSFVAFVLRFACVIPGIAYLIRKAYHLKNSLLEREVAGLKFPNPVGLAAGFDKNAIMYKEMGCLGFGFVEVGTVTPIAQKGNEKPRLFRLHADDALINRMGFNNDGLKKIARRLSKRGPGQVLGGNIGKNKDVSIEDAFTDYKMCFNGIYKYVDYFVVNVSSPNTPGLRRLQEKEPLKKLLTEIQDLNENHFISKPVFLKIAPDLTDTQIDDIIKIVIDCRISGIIATNTTLNRDGLKTDVIKMGSGGLSGKPLLKRSTEIVRYIYQKSNGAIPIIASGGIHSVADAMEKFDAGASLIELYTGFIYEGPSLIKKINKELIMRAKQKQTTAK